MANMKRRTFLKCMGILAGSLGVSIAAAAGSRHRESPKATDSALPAKSPLSVFKLGVISDELSRDFEQALSIMKKYGLSWVEIRNVWGTYNTEASPAQIQNLKDLLKKYEFKVSVLDTALYKCALPGTTPVVNQKDAYPYSGQMDLLKRAMERAQALGTDKLRVFAFWRVADPEQHFPRIAEELSKAAEVARGGGMRLLLEDEGSCNVATGHELAHTLKLVPAANLGANWDVGNPTWHGEISFPDGYAALDKQRIWHMHLKDVRCDPDHEHCKTAIVGTGQVNLLGQFRALAKDKYQGTMSLEPEYQAPGITHLEATQRSLEALLKIMATALEGQGLGVRG